MNKLLLIPIILVLLLIPITAYAVALPIVTVSADDTVYNKNDKITVTMKIQGWDLNPSQKAKLTLTDISGSYSDLVTKFFKKPLDGDTVEWVIPHTKLAAQEGSNYLLTLTYGHYQAFTQFTR